MPACPRPTGYRPSGNVPSRLPTCPKIGAAPRKVSYGRRPSPEPTRAHPYQVSRAKRCADRRFPKSPLSVRGEGMRSNRQTWTDAPTRCPHQCQPPIRVRWTVHSCRRCSSGAIRHVASKPWDGRRGNGQCEFSQSNSCDRVRAQPTRARTCSEWSLARHSTNHGYLDTSATSGRCRKA
jgi:hypothetical protein